MSIIKNATIPGTKTRITITQYDDVWVWESDTDVTDYLLMGQPNIDSEIEEDVGAFKKDNLTIDFEDEAGTIRSLISTDDKYFLILIEKGLDGIADWITIFDGVIDFFETVGKARNIISITAYSMEEEFENGAKAMLRYIQEKGTCCYGSDNCVICEAGRKFLRRRKKK